MDTKKKIRLGVLMVYLGGSGMVYFADHNNIFFNAVFFMIAIFGLFFINEQLELLK